MLYFPFRIFIIFWFLPIFFLSSFWSAQVLGRWWWWEHAHWERNGMVSDGVKELGEKEILLILYLLYHQQKIDWLIFDLQNDNDLATCIRTRNTFRSFLTTFFILMKQILWWTVRWSRCLSVSYRAFGSNLGHRYSWFVNLSIAQY